MILLSRFDFTGNYTLVIAAYADRLQDELAQIRLRFITYGNGMPQLLSEAAAGNGMYAGASNNDRTLAQRDKAHNKRWSENGVPGETLAVPTDNMKRDETKLIQALGSDWNKQKISNKQEKPGWVYLHRYPAAAA